MEFKCPRCQTVFDPELRMEFNHQIFKCPECRYETIFIMDEDLG